MGAQMTQRVLVTAGAGGIGLAIAEAFATAGAQVLVCDIDAAAVERLAQGGSGILATVADVSAPADVGRLFREVTRQLGGLDVLVNNAGIGGPTAPVESYDPVEWRRVIEVNLNGTFHVTACAIPLLRQSEAASILIMSSLAGRFGYPNRSAYAVTKWGLVGFTKTLAMELGPDGITCNCIAPGAVEGSRIRAVLEGRAAASGDPVETEIERALANQSVKQFVDPADIAALAVFLAGPHARSISGQLFPIDGDSKSTV
jgi:NAD(P)-dependent dehydrogenase (short-subunit alcohol dehydrogenase family)